MKFLITGGSGFLGINLIRFLLARNHQIVSLDIADFDYPDVKDKITHIKADVREADAVNYMAQGVDIIVHCAMALPLYPAEEILSTGVKGTHTVLEAARRNRVKRFIHISSTAVYGIPDHHPLYETDRLEGVGPYGLAKVKAEEECVHYRKKGLCIPVLRPKSFIGPERLGVFSLLYEWAKDKKNFPMIGSGNNRFQLLDVEDLCEAIYSCVILDEEQVNTTFNIGAKEFTTMRQDYQVVLNEAGFNKKIIGLPAMPIIMILRVLEALKISPLYKWVYETAAKDSFVSIEKAEKLLNYQPKYSNQQALLRNYQWYLANLDSFKEKTGVSHRVPWKQGILKVAKIFF